MKKKITLCSSATFFEKLWGIKDAIEKRGYEVLLPSMENFNRRGEHGFAKIQHGLIREHFKKIDQADAIYVANYDKKGIQGYIGGNTFLEMGKAFDRGIPIFLMHPIPEMSYRDELVALQPVIIGHNFETWTDFKLHFIIVLFKYPYLQGYSMNMFLKSSTLMKK